LRCQAYPPPPPPPTNIHSIAECAVIDEYPPTKTFAMRYEMPSLLFMVWICSIAGALTTRHRAHRVHERRLPTTQVWKRLPSSISPDSVFTLAIALTQENLESAERELLSVSDPSSPFFGHYWSPARVKAHFSATDENSAQIANWLEDSGIHRRRLEGLGSGDWILFNITVREAERLLKTKYRLFARHDGQDTHLGCDQYSLPESVRPFIDFVMPTVHLGVRGQLGRRHEELASARGVRRTERSARSLPLAGRQATDMGNASLDISTCRRRITPDCLRAMYHLPTSNTSHPANSFGIFQASLASWLPADLDAFFSSFAPSLIGKRPTIVSVNGGQWQDRVQRSLFNLEPDLDFEYAMALSAPLPLIDYQVGTMVNYSLLSPLLAAFDGSYCSEVNNSASLPNTPASEIINVLTFNHSECGSLRPPAVLAVSYGENELALTPAFIRRQCIEFLKLGLMGTTVVVGSGDCGPAGQACECVDPVTGRMKEDSKTGAFGVTYPAACPYVTAVGATQLPPNGSITDREVALRYAYSRGLATSGGGFSYEFPVPSYQASATAKYLTSERSYLNNISSLFNARGRGVPDVAAHAANYVTVVNGKRMTVFGTSASTPVFASIIALVNDARLRAGKSTVGFINPVLYANPHMMNDVIEGGSYGCGKEAFRARNGWDPVTGLGTPDFEKLVDLYLSLP